MVNKRDLAVVALATFCLTATLFLIIPSRSQTPEGYNPWFDLNDDGSINILESIIIGNHFLTSGTPINKSEIAVSGYMSKPAYDSGWQNISQGQYKIFNHFLNTTDVLVYMMGKINVSASPYIHQVDYGGELNVVYYGGAWWQDLTESTITVHRRPNDPNWCQVRVMIWKLPEP